jgi:hypothetical protein
MLASRGRFQRGEAVATLWGAGSVAPGKMGGHCKRVLEPHRGFIVERLKETPAPYAARFEGGACRARGLRLAQCSVAVPAA